MEIDITHMVESADDMPTLSGSAAEWGQNAGQFTWNNSKAYGRLHPLLKSDDERETARNYFAEFGAWSREEIAAWDETELQGIVCQDIAANIREMEHFDSYEEYQAASEQGRVSGNVYRGDDGRWYYYFGH